VLEQPFHAVIFVCNCKQQVPAPRRKTRQRGKKRKRGEKHRKKKDETERKGKRIEEKRREGSTGEKNRKKRERKDGEEENTAASSFQKPEMKQKKSANKDLNEKVNQKRKQQQKERKKHRPIRALITLNFVFIFRQQLHSSSFSPLCKFSCYKGKIITLTHACIVTSRVTGLSQ
jgi:hypothetical protein